MGFDEEFLRRFRWIDGHADVLGLFADGAFLQQAAQALAVPFDPGEVTKVAGIEARGFVLGAAVAVTLGVGFVPIRKCGAIHPGPKVTARAAVDWRGNEPELALQRAAVSAKDRVLVVDDWIETGSQAFAARKLIEGCGGQWVGLSVLVDQSTPAMRQSLKPFAAVVRAESLPPSI